MLESVPACVGGSVADTGTSADGEDDEQEDPSSSNPQTVSITVVGLYFSGG